MEQLEQFSSVLGQFSHAHTLHMDRGQAIFDRDLLRWHSDLLSLQVGLCCVCVCVCVCVCERVCVLPLQTEVHKECDIVWSETSSLYIFSTLFYIVRTDVLRRNLLYPPSV